MPIGKFYNSIWKRVAVKDKERFENQDNSMLDKCEVEKNIEYGLYGKFNTFNMIYPKNAKFPMPFIINLHGGGYIYGDKCYSDLQCAYFAQQGFCVVNANYRLAKTHKFPAPMNDVFNLYHFLRNEYKDKLDFNNMFLAGDSAGAHINSLVACISNSDILREDYNIHPSFKVRGCAFSSGVFETFSLFNLRKILFGARNKKYHKLSSTFEIMNSSFPPSIIISAKNDPLLFQQNKFSRKCKKLNIPCKQVIMSGSKEIQHVFNVMYPNSECGKTANLHICKFLNQQVVKRKEVETVQQISTVPNQFKQTVIETTICQIPDEKNLTM